MTLWVKRVIKLSTQHQKQKSSSMKLKKGCVADHERAVDAWIVLHRSTLYYTWL